MESLSNPTPDYDIERRLGELMLALMKPDTAIYIDIYPLDPEHPEEYTYEYSEVRNGQE